MRRIARYTVIATGLSLLLSGCESGPTKTTESDTTSAADTTGTTVSDAGDIILQLDTAAPDSESNDVAPDSLADTRLPDAGDLGARRATLWRPYEEWSLNDTSWSGNPFDVVAKVTFTHRKSGASHVTQMFYDGADTWKFRFTGTKTGLWRFQTRADGTNGTTDDPDLNGHSGLVDVQPNPDPEAHGFLTNDGNQWRWQGEKKPFVPQLLMYSGHETVPDELGDDNMVDAAITEFLDKHGFTGFEISMLSGYWFDADAGKYDVDASMKNPDPETFAALESAIQKVHAAGGAFHFWMWGDAARGWTNKSLAGGINGKQDRRLQRYMAARLGPIPGWSAGYGFDLDEWAKSSQVDAWNRNMQQLLGWHHFLGGRPVGPNSGIDHSSFNSWNDDLEYSSYEHHKPDYEVAVGALSELTDQPVLSEDRNRVRNSNRQKDWSETETRRGLWQTTMAGGMANIWGQLETSNQVSNTGVYGNRRQLATYSKFWFDKGRYLSGITRANNLSNDTGNSTPNEIGNDSNTRVLKASDDQLVFYRQDASSIHLDLSGLSSPQPAVAVDTKKAYSETDLGMLQPKSQTLDLGSTSDWAIAIGTFP